MARRRESYYSSTEGRYKTRFARNQNQQRFKSEAEARVERFTWFALVIVFAVTRLVDSMPPVVVPIAGAVILLGSGAYQYSRRWRVSPVTWLAGALMAGIAYLNLQVNPTRDFTGLALLVFAGVIAFGLLTGET